MNAFIIVLTMFSAPVDVASNAPMTLAPVGTIEFHGTTEKQAISECTRVAKALIASGDMLAYCGDVTAPTE